MKQMHHPDETSGSASMSAIAGRTSAALSIARPWPSMPATLPGVVHAADQGYTCSEPGQVQIKHDIREHGLNRVVVASCSPRLHEPTFRQCVSEAGLNPYLMEMANIREQCSWVHGHDPAGATQKAKDLVRSAVARARLLDGTDGARGAGRPLHPGHRRRRGGHPGRSRPGRCGLPCRPGGEAAEHRRHHGPAGQDLSRPWTVPSEYSGRR